VGAGVDVGAGVGVGVARGGVAVGVVVGVGVGRGVTVGCGVCAGRVGCRASIADGNTRTTSARVTAKKAARPRGTGEWWRFAQGASTGRLRDNRYPDGGAADTRATADRAP
jgi:hypothetical protein